MDLPEIQEVLPTNLPTVRANELRIDHLFRLADGTVAVIDYESDYDEADKVKYLNYLIGIANRYQTEGTPCPTLRMIVIYTGDIERKKVSCQYDIGAVHMEIEPAFLLELDAERIFPQLKEKIERNELLNDEELMEFILLPLSYRKKREKKEKLQEVVELAAEITDKKQQMFTLAGLLVFTDKIMDQKTAKRIRRVMEMTQVERIYEEEKRQELEALAKKYEKEKRQVTEQFKKEKRQATEQFKKEKQQAAEQFEKEKLQIVLRLLKKGETPEEIASLVSGYTVEEIQEWKEVIA